MDKKYPSSLFWTQLIMDFLVRHIYLCIPGFTLVIVGIWVRPCLYIGIGFLLLDAGLSLFSALRTRSVFLNSNDPNFKEAQDAVLSANWDQNLRDLVECKIQQQGPNTDVTEDPNERPDHERYTTQ